MPSKRELEKVTARKKARINGVIAELDEAAVKAQTGIYNDLAKQFLAKLIKDDNGLISPAKNKKLVAAIEKIFREFQTKGQLSLIKKFIVGVEEILDINSDYYQSIQPDARMGELAREVKLAVKASLGIGKDNQLVKNGYLDKLVSNPEARMKVKRLALQKMGGSFFDMRDSMKKLVVGDPKNYGLLQGYYRNYAYDSISQADAVAGKKFADALGLNFAVYEGGLIATSRAFCRKRNGHVFHRSQIARFSPTEARQPDYNPFIHLGGYGCRHFLSWVSDELAVYLDAAMKKFVAKQ